MARIFCRPRKIKKFNEVNWFLERIQLSKRRDIGQKEQKKIRKDFQILPECWQPFELGGNTG